MLRDWPKVITNQCCRFCRIYSEREKDLMHTLAFLISVKAPPPERFSRRNNCNSKLLPFSSFPVSTGIDIRSDVTLFKFSKNITSSINSDIQQTNKKRFHTPACDSRWMKWRKRRTRMKCGGKDENWLWTSWPRLSSIRCLV